MLPNPQENDNHAYDDNHETKHDTSDNSDGKNGKHSESNPAAASKNYINNGDISDGPKKAKDCWTEKANNNCDKQRKTGEGGYFYFLSHSIVSSLENFFYW